MFNSTPIDRNTLKFLAAIFATNIGNGIQTLAAGYLTLNATGSGSAVGAFYILIAIPPALFSAFVGSIARHSQKKFVAIICDLSRAFLVLSIAIASQFSQDDYLIMVVYIASFGIAVFDAVFNPISNALLKTLSHEEERSRISALFEGATQGGALLSVAIGGLLVASLGPTIAFILNSITFIASAVLLWSIQDSHPATALAPRTHSPSSLTSVSFDKFTACAVLLFALGRVVVLVGNTLLLVLIVKVRDQGMQTLGFTDACAGIGVLLASFIAMRLCASMDSLRQATLGYIGCCVFVAILPWGETIWIMSSLTISAFFFGIGRIGARALILERSYNNSEVLLFGLSNGLGIVLASVTVFGSCWVAEHSSIQSAYQIFAVTVLLITLICLVIIRNHKAALLPSKEING